MQAAPRCQALTKAELPCKKPALKGTPLCTSHSYEPARPIPLAEHVAHRRRAYAEQQQAIRARVREVEQLVRKVKVNDMPDWLIDELGELRRGLLELADRDATPLITVARKKGIPTQAKAAMSRTLQASATAAPMSSPENAPAEVAHERTRDRALGAMLGLAVGEAFGVTTTGLERGTFRDMADMHGGGLLGVKRGEWGWDTASMLVLSDNLIENRSFEPRDFLERLTDHRDHGSYSPANVKINPGNMTALALNRFEQFGELIAIEQTGVRPENGCLARLAPVAVRHWQRTDRLLKIAERQARATHSGEGVGKLSRSFAEVVAMAIANHDRGYLLSGRYWEKNWGRMITFGELRQIRESRVISDEHAEESFRAALWCVATGDGFKGALVRARNLGGDAMSVGAMAGQLAGAIYGARAIPQHWLECLAGRDRIEETALHLFDAGMVEAQGR